ncbi:MAG TPA: YqhA family protein [Chitinophagaceae bacterium]|jgi:uncharacterized membrane protein YqhA|nr:YqhA family protein [Chitinophagaceae bacterium]
MKQEHIAERLLWNSRFIVIIAVVASILVCLGMYIIATLDVIHLTENIFFYLTHDYPAINESENIAEARSVIVSNIVEIIDGYLLATTILIFSFGLYELFISRIDAAQSNLLSSRILSIQSIDDLKERLSKLILLILIVKFFEFALEQKFTSSLDLVYFGLGIFLVGAALWLSHKKEIGNRKEPKEE